MLALDGINLSIDSGEFVVISGTIERFFGALPYVLVENIILDSGN